jgi:hypothetical protein
VENKLRDARCGSYATARVVLRVCGVTAVTGTVDLLSDPPEEPGIDFFEYQPAGSEAGSLRFVFLWDGEITISGTDCELRYEVLAPLA